ncbi:MAG: serine/threonine-protein kinase [Caldilineaceae bacterium]
MAKDIVFANTPISVKDESHIVLNPSPYVLFVSIPTGPQWPTKSDNWYSSIAPASYQNFYAFARDTCNFDLPDTIVEYHKVVRKPRRRLFQAAIDGLTAQDKAEFTKRYIAFCHEIAEASATLFTKKLDDSLSTPIKNSIMENIVRNFFRLSDSEYVLCGLDGKMDFGVILPDITSWRQNWSLRHVTAKPDLSRNQSVVKFELSFVEKRTRKERCLPFHAQVRWSRRKFGGNPEAKLYKDFAWSEVPFLPQIYQHEAVTRLELIGNGGFGIVYKAILRQTGEVVAVKELDTSKLTFSPEELHEERSRFEREVSIQSTLSHPNILPVLESDLNASTPWFATPLAANSVADIAEELVGNFVRINVIFRQVLVGLEYAHSCNVIHRDLKPENVLLFANDHVMIGDFGLGKQLNADDPGIALTQTSNNSLGSLAYSAPEQLQSFRDADHRADIYALGKTLLHMLTGNAPMSSGLINQVNERYRAFIHRCIQDEPSDRFPSMSDALMAFDSFTTSIG